MSLFSVPLSCTAHGIEEVLGGDAVKCCLHLYILVGRSL